MTHSNEYKKIDWKDNTIEWKDIIKKEARGYEKGDDLGEVQEIGKEFVVTERGRISKHRFYLPKQGCQYAKPGFSYSCGQVATAII